MPSRKARVAVLLAAAGLSTGAVAGPAQAQSTQSQQAITQSQAGWGQAIPVTGTTTNANKKAFTGTFSIKRFVYQGDKLYAVGTLKGKAKNRPVTRRGVRWLVTDIANAPTARTAQNTQPIPPTQGACQVLNLVLGPLDLNLLGLRVRLNQVRLLIEAVPSGGGTGGQAGGLLGDLLCGITNLLAPSANSPLDAVTRLLNALLALAGPAPTLPVR